MMKLTFPVLVGLLHLAVALGAALLLLTTNPELIMGVHPALKPMKFGLSIGIFLLTIAVLLPLVAAPARAKRVVGTVLSVTMLAETTVILTQAVRGTTSHFNQQGLLNAVGWQVMVFAIVVATLTMGWLAVVSQRRPLREPTGEPIGASRQLAWRAGLWIFMLSAVSGFAMGGRLSHSVGGEDGGPGLPVVNWSTTHGDLRVSHFFALHALQLLPLLDFALSKRLEPRTRLRVMRFTSFTYAAICLGTLVQAFVGRPLL